MFVNRIVLTLSIILFSLFQSNIFASIKSDSEKLKSYCQSNKHLNISKKTTDNKSGEEYYHFYIKIKNSTSNDEEILDCSYFGIGPVLAKKLPGIEHFSGNLICSIPKNYSGLRDILNLELKITDVVSKVKCSEKEKTPILSGKCGKELGCNLLRSALNISTLGSYTALSNFIHKDVSADKKLCLDTRQSDCMTEAMTGIVKNIWANIEGIGFLLKSAGSYTWNGVKNFGSSLFGSKEAQPVEDKSSEAMHMASSESKSSLNKFLTHPKQYMVNLGSKIYNFLMKAAGDSFGCAQWEGAPHTSNCVKYLDSWECSTCDQRINTLCGVMGFMGGEIVTAFLTGGTINLLGKVGRAAGLGKAFSSLGKATEGSKVVAALAKVGGYAGSVVTLPFVALAKIPGLKQFLHANDVAFMYGLQGGKKISSLNTVAKTSTTMDDATSFPKGLSFDDADKIITKSKKGLSGTQSEQLDAIDELGSLKINLQSKMSKRTREVDYQIVSVVDDLYKVIKTTRNEKIRLKAMNALTDYTKKNSGNYEMGFLGLQSESMLKGIYKNSDLPDNIRRLAFNEVESIRKSSATPSIGKFKTASELKKLNIVKQEKLPSPPMRKGLSFDDADKIITKSKKGLSGAQSEQLDAIDKLGSLKIDLQARTSRGIREVDDQIVSVVDDLYKVIETTKNEKIRLKAMNALTDYTKRNSGNYKIGFLGRQSKEMLKDIYKNSDLPDNIRRLAFNEVESIRKSSATPSIGKFKTASELKKLNIVKQEKLPSPPMRLDQTYKKITESRKALSGNQSEQLKAIGELGDLKINLPLQESKIVEKIDSQMVSVADDLYEIIKTTKSDEIRLKAMNSLEKYVRRNTGDYIVGNLNSTASKILDKIYYNTKLPDKIREIAFYKNKGVNRIYFRDRFKTGQQLIDQELAQKQANLLEVSTRKNNLIAADKAFKSEKAGNTFNEYAKAGNFEEIKFANDKRMKTLEGLKSNEGLEAIVRFDSKANGNVVELKGIIIKEKEYSFYLENNGAYTEINSNYGDIKKVFVRKPILAPTKKIQEAASSYKSKSTLETKRSLSSVPQDYPSNMKIPTDGSAKSLRRTKQNELTQSLKREADLRKELLEGNSLNHAPKPGTIKVSETEVYIESNNDHLRLLNQEQYNSLPDGIVLESISGEKLIKGSDPIPLDKIPFSPTNIRLIYGFRDSKIKSGYGYQGPLNSSTSNALKKLREESDKIYHLEKNINLLKYREPIDAALVDSKSFLVRRGGKSIEEYAKDGAYTQVQYIDMHGLQVTPGHANNIGNEIVIKFKMEVGGDELIQLEGKIIDETAVSIIIMTPDGSIHSVNSNLTEIKQVFVRKPRVTTSQ